LDCGAAGEDGSAAGGRDDSAGGSGLAELRVLDIL
jgi:hypothetical protein